MLLNSLKTLQIFKKTINYIVLKKEYKFLVNTFQILIQKNMQNFFFQFLKKSSFWCINEIVDITAIDKNVGNNRFLILYLLLSEKFNFRGIIRLNTDGIVIVNSVSKFFKGVTWLEREVFDMFGIFFKQNNDLRRILTDYGFEGFPLRKDFPVFGFIEKYYSISENIIISNKISLIQEFRFDIRKS